MVNLTVNGKPRPIDADVDLETYLESFGLNLQFVAVGYNGEVIKKEEYAGLKLKDGDVLESSAGSPTPNLKLLPVVVFPAVTMQSYG